VLAVVKACKALVTKETALVGYIGIQDMNCKNANKTGKKELNEQGEFMYLCKIKTN
jgi:hypothetical protein